MIFFMLIEMLPKWVVDLTWYNVLYQKMVMNKEAKQEIYSYFYAEKKLFLEEINYKIFLIITFSIIFIFFSLLLYKKLKGIKATGKKFIIIVLLSVFHAILLGETIISLPILLLVIFVMYIVTQDENTILKYIRIPLHILPIIVFIGLQIYLNSGLFWGFDIVLSK
ncbi:hypothetical protein [Campylobacter fetus]|uniref:hypothetical protein n=2 Tax=Campylobacter fetus TaxID=196 RepID=UPI00073AC202|nr:hypothetical protein [Campylobacter fetus]ALV65021.1 hypothetical membrane protein [Campylobacter fetus subsp. testudinum Sp3]OCR85824.1 hypothetical protein CFT12S05168_02365 [Campylobacter fetus subsp. testudinum]